MCASLSSTSSLDFCNTTRSADSPRDSFVPRACAGRSQTRSPPVLAHRKLRAALLPCGRTPAEDTEDPRVASLSRGERSESPGSMRPEHSVVTDTCVRALGCPSLSHQPRSRFVFRRSATSGPPRTHAPRRADILQRTGVLSIATIDSLRGDRSPCVVRPVSLRGSLVRRSVGRADAFVTFRG